MEMLIINEGKLKIMLSREDLEDFELDAEDLDYSNTETKRMIWDLLGRAKRTLGFTTDGYRLLVRLYPCRQGGCEIFISRITPTEEKDKKTSSHSLTSAEKSPSSRRGAYVFRELDSLLCVCRRLSEIGYDGGSRAYLGEDRRYYLLLEGMKPSDYLPFDEYTFIGEYGHPESVEAVSLMLTERARPLCEQNAVPHLGKI
jgi:negative regulator of genetic competence, sporulation and motility